MALPQPRGQGKPILRFLRQLGWPGREQRYRRPAGATTWWPGPQRPRRAPAPRRRPRPGRRQLGAAHSPLALDGLEVLLQAGLVVQAALGRAGLEGAVHGHHVGHLAVRLLAAQVAAAVELVQHVGAAKPCGGGKARAGVGHALRHRAVSLTARRGAPAAAAAPRPRRPAGAHCSLKAGPRPLLSGPQALGSPGLVSQPHRGAQRRWPARLHGRP